MGFVRISAHSLTSEVGIGSRMQDLDGEDFRILSCLLGQSIFNGIGSGD